MVGPTAEELVSIFEIQPSYSFLEFEAISVRFSPGGAK